MPRSVTAPTRSNTAIAGVDIMGVVRTWWGEWLLTFGITVGLALVGLGVYTLVTGCWLK